MTQSMTLSQQIDTKHYETQARLDLGGTYCNRGRRLPFPPHSGLHPAVPPRSPRNNGLVAERHSYHNANFTPRWPLLLARLFASNATNSRAKPSVGWGKGGCGGPFCILAKEAAGGRCLTRRSRDPAGRVRPPWTRHISIHHLIWQHGPGVNQNSRIVCQKCIFQVSGPIWHT